MKQNQVWDTGAHDFARLGAGVAFMDLEPDVGISYPQNRNASDCGWKKIICNKVWIKAKACKQVKVSFGKEQPNRWIAVLLRLSRWKVITPVGLITGHTELNTHRYKTGTSAYQDCRFCGVKKETTKLSCLTVKHCRTWEDQSGLHRGAMP